MKKKYPLCPFDHPECFARNKNWKCMILEDTTFKPGRDCPFYKHIKDVDLDTIMMILVAEAEET